MPRKDDTTYINQCGELVPIPNTISALIRQVLNTVIEANQLLSQMDRHFSMLFFPDAESSHNSTSPLVEIRYLDLTLLVVPLLQSSAKNRLCWAPGGLYTPQRKEVELSFAVDAEATAMQMLWLVGTLRGSANAGFDERFMDDETVRHFYVKHEPAYWAGTEAPGATKLATAAFKEIREYDISFSEIANAVELQLGQSELLDINEDTDTENPSRDDDCANDGDCPKWKHCDACDFIRANRQV